MLPLACSGSVLFLLRDCAQRGICPLPISSRCKPDPTTYPRYSRGLGPRNLSLQSNKSEALYILRTAMDENIRTLKTLNIRTLKTLNIRTLKTLNITTLKTLNITTLKTLNTRTLKTLNTRTLKTLDIRTLKTLDIRTLKTLYTRTLKTRNIRPNAAYISVHRRTRRRKYVHPAEGAKRCSNCYCCRRRIVTSVGYRNRVR